MRLYASDTNLEKEIIIRGNCDNPPFEFIDKNGKPAGYSIEIIEALMKEMKQPYVLTMDTLSEIIKDLQNGKADLLPNIGYSPTRAKTMKFGVTHSYVLMKVISRKDNPINSLNDLNGKIGIVLNKGLTEEVVEENNVAQIIEVPNPREGIKRLSRGEADAMFVIKETAEYIIEQENINNLQLNPIDLMSAEYCYVGNDEALLAKMRLAFYKLKKDGEYDRIHDKWFGNKTVSRLKTIQIILIFLIIFITILSGWGITKLNIKKRREMKFLSELMKLVIKNGNTTVWIYHIKKHYTEHIYGKLPGDNTFSVEHNNENIHPEDIDNITELGRSLIKGEIDNAQMICRIRIDDTRYHYFKCTMYIKKKKNIPIYIIGTLSDVNSEYHYKQLLTETNGKLLYALKNSNIVFFEIDPKENTIEFYNSILEFHPDGLKYPINKCMSLVYEEDRKKLDKTLYKINNSKEIDESLSLRHIDEKTNQMLYYIIKIFSFEKDKNGNVTKYIGLLINNTATYNYQKELREYRNKLKIIINHSNLVIWEYNREIGEYKSEGDDLVSPYNYPASKNIIEMIPVDDREKFIVFERKIKNGENIGEINVRLILPNSNDAYYFTIGCAPVRYDKKGKILQYIGYRVNTSESNYLELERKRADMAEKADKMKSEFLANMSHEIRTPLNAIVGFSQIIGEAEDEAEKKQFNEIINYNSHFLMHIIDDLLTFSKIEAGLLKINISKFDFNDIFRNSYYSSKFQATNNGLELLMNITMEKCMIEGDRERVTQILNNLLSNAIKYTRTGGKVEMSYEIIDEGLRFSVQDNGIGIAEDKQSKIFQRFEKLDTFAKGTGLGLSICKSLVEKMNGKIGFQSKENEGSTFWVWLPLHRS